MNVVTIVDAGPLVALLASREHHHAWAVSTFAQTPVEDMVTCEAVISECSFLLARWPAAIDGIFRRLAEGTLRLVAMNEDAIAIGALMKKYRNVPASFADACLIRLSEKHPAATVLTTDSDFAIYRRNGRQSIPLLMPPRPFANVNRRLSAC